ncbi:MAG: hypothetical protein AAB388_03840 [Patescibacteria group bacterium]
MGNDTKNIYERLFKQEATINKLVLDGSRDPHVVAGVFQSIIDKSATSADGSKKFALLVDLGTIVVPENYEHETALARFATANRGKCYYFNNLLTDANFNHPSRVLKPGDRLQVRAFHQIVSGTTTSEERLAFLRTQGAVFTGAQGAALVFEQKRNQLPKGKWYASFDEMECLPSLENYHRVPDVYASTDGDFSVDLGYFEEVWHQRHAFFCFSDEDLSAA